jgi:hypothetical protein
MTAGYVQRAVWHPSYYDRSCAKEDVVYLGGLPVRWRDRIPLVSSGEVVPGHSAGYAGADGVIPCLDEPAVVGARVSVPRETVLDRGVAKVRRGHNDLRQAQVSQHGSEITGSCCGCSAAPGCCCCSSSAAAEVLLDGPGPASQVPSAGGYDRTVLLRIGALESANALAYVGNARGCPASFIDLLTRPDQFRLSASPRLFWSRSQKCLERTRLGLAAPDNALRLLGSAVGNRRRLDQESSDLLVKVRQCPVNERERICTGADLGHDVSYLGIALVLPPSSAGAAHIDSSTALRTGSGSSGSA